MRLLLAAATSAFLAASPVGAQTVSFATNPPGSVNYATGAAIAQVYTETTGMQMRVVPQGGPEAILPLVVQGQFDFTLPNTVALNFAYKGKDTFPEPLEELRAVATVFPLLIGMYVKADSGIDSVEDLAGKRIASGYPQQRNLASFTEVFLAAAGLQEGDYQPVLVPNGSRALDDFTAGSLDAGVWSLTSGRMSEVDVSVGGLKWLPLPESEAVTAAIDEHAPGARAGMIEPRPSIPGAEEPFRSLIIPFVIVTSAETSDEAVYNLAKVLHQQKAELEAAVPAFKGMVLEELASPVGIPYHPAALRYYEEAGVPTPQG